MRILCLATEYPPAQGYGLGRYTFEHCQALAAAGAQVEVVCNNHDGRREMYQEGQVTVYNVPFLLPFHGYHSVADILQGNVTLFTRAAELFRQGRHYDVIQIHDWLAASAGHALQQTFSVPLVVAMHDTELGKSLGQLAPEQQYVVEMERWICEQADAVAANSEFLKQELVQAYHLAPERISVIGAGVTPQRFDAKVDRDQFRSLFCAPQQPMILFVGRLTPLKGPQVLLEAMPEILSVLPEAQLVIAGDGALHEPMQQRLQELGLTGRVRFIGHIGTRVLGAVYRAADVLVVPSLYEPLGMVALEGMACGVPVVAADAGGLAEIIDNGRTGLLVPPNDSRALAGAVIRMVANAGLAAHLAAASHERALNNYTWEQVAERSVALYAGCAALT